MKKYLLLILLITSVIFFYKVATSFRMTPSYNYDSDFGRDLWMMERITQGKFTLVGPQFSFSGLRLAPYHFYLFAPFLAVFDSYKAVVYVNAGLFVVAFMALFMLIRKQYGNLYTFLSVIWIATTPYIILSGRSPGNAFTYMTLLVLYLAYFFTARRIGYLAILVLGFMGGIIVNYHPISAVAVFAPFLTRKIFVNDQWLKRKILNSVYFLVSFTLTFLPVIVFDLKHGFVIVKSVFSPKAAEFVTGEYVKSITSLAHLVDLNNQSFQWVPVTILGLLLILTVAYIYARKTELRGWYVMSVVTAFVFLVLGKGAAHYFFPTILLLQLMIVFFLKPIAFDEKVPMILLVAVNIIFFPLKFYAPARSLESVERNFNSAIAKMEIPKKSLNTFLVNDTNLSAVGYEYRYLLTKNGYRVDDEYSYSLSSNLLMVLEKTGTDWTGNGAWELTQFASKKVVEKTKIGDYEYYLLSK